jgi:hypothetical protein
VQFEEAESVDVVDNYADRSAIRSSKEQPQASHRKASDL